MRKLTTAGASVGLSFLLVCGSVLAGDLPPKLAPLFEPPPQYAGKLGSYRSPLLFDDGTRVSEAKDWPRRRKEILHKWHGVIGAWPPLIDHPGLEVLEKIPQPDHERRRVRVQVAKDQWLTGYLLVPPGKGPFPAVLVPYYEPMTSLGIGNQPLRDFGLQLARRGFVTLSIGSPGGDARKPDVDGAPCQPLSYLAYVSANCANALADQPEVDAKRIGVVGHSYGGKWAMFGSCLCERFAAACWCDPGIVFDEPRANVNYWEPWYLGYDPALSAQRKAGLVTADNPRTGAYKTMVDRGMDLVELHALMAPRAVLVSGGSEDTVERWVALNHLVAVNEVLGFKGRVGMHNRKDHTPTEESNGVIYAFFEHFLK
jgi:dienelactone hydrolase